MELINTLNQLLEIVFWLVLIGYIGARFIQSIQRFKQQH